MKKNLIINVVGYLNHKEYEPYITFFKEILDGVDFSLWLGPKQLIKQENKEYNVHHKIVFVNNFINNKSDYTLYLKERWINHFARAFKETKNLNSSVNKVKQNQILIGDDHNHVIDVDKVNDFTNWVTFFKAIFLDKHITKDKFENVKTCLNDVKYYSDSEIGKIVDGSTLKLIDKHHDIKL